ncbi:hypothetical protein ALC62_02846 [Cyphomyrmex costatus]|uniref:Transposase domain-containing protein n=1 Tax=Cyphomyrmex costatus TaxID=456900 RepID=A0A151IMM5_9HYME|nr:hypothetical protein ALC62_02846 [Cyphomyrmex costatus]
MFIVLQDDVLLYKNSHLTNKQTRHLIMAYAFRHVLSEKALKDLLLFNCILPQKVFPSLYTFTKHFEKHSSSDVKKHFYCQSCDAYLKFKNTINTVECVYCNVINNKKDLQKAGKYFLTSSIENKIQQLMKDPNIISAIEKYDVEDVSSVRSGTIYKQLKQTGVIGLNSISIQWNTDGAQVFHSSKKSMWPIQIGINELPYSLLERIANMMQYNGKWGCLYCLNEGTRITKGRGFSRVYLPEIGELRTEEQVFEDAERAVLQNETIRGIKGYSIMSEVPLFNIVTSLVPDYMHALLLGVVYAFCEIWFSSEHHQSPWYLGLQENEISNRLQNLMPTSEITRLPSSIKKRYMWKASELRYFLLYYSIPVFKNIMQSKYYKHWFLLVYSFHLLLNNKVILTDIHKAECAIKKFVQQTEILYGTEYLTFNMHLLLHIPQYVKYWGAPWDSSAFMFEHGNRVLLKLFRGTQSVGNQIFKSYNYIMKIKKDNVEIFNEDFFKPATRLIETLIEGPKYSAQKCIQEDALTLIGSDVLFELTLQMKIALENCLLQPISSENVDYQIKSFSRFIWKGSLYHTAAYERLQKRDNCITQLIDGRFFQINRVLYITELRQSVLVGQELLPTNEVLVKDSTLNIQSNFFIHVVKLSVTSVNCVPMSYINRKCMRLIVNDKMFVIPIVNKFERD